MTAHAKHIRWLIVSVAILMVFAAAGCSAVTQSDRPGSDPQSQSVTSDDANSGTTSGEVAAVIGRVTDSAGNPLDQATVTVPRGSAAVPEMTAITSSDGVYQWNLPTGTFTLEVHKDGYVPALAEVSIAIGDTVTQDFILQAQ